MNAVLESFLSGFPVLILHFAVTVAMLAAGVIIYTLITPHREFRMVRSGNVAAAISLSGAVLGIGIPLAFCMAVSVSVFDILVWGAVTVVIQLAAYFVTDLIMRGLPARIDQGEVAAALLLVAIKLAIAAITAAAVSG
ncbi:MAG: DUF350 domain-containing protein [Gammaproteobacteria bacterium]